MIEPDPLEAFNRRLEALLDGGQQPEAGAREALPPADRQALEIAVRLAALNPSLESSARYPLRRRLLAGLPFGEPRRSWESAARRLSPGLALLLALVCVFAGMAAGLSVSPTQAAPSVAQTAAWQPLTASSPMQSEQPVLQLNPIPAPTPLAPPGSTALAPRLRTQIETPGRSTPSGIQYHPDAGSNAGGL